MANRVSRAVAAAVCAAVIAVSQAPAAVAQQVPPLSSMSSDAAGRARAQVNDAWRRGYEALPPQARHAVPRELRPAQPVAQPAPPAQPEPAPAPPHTCDNCVALTFDDGPTAQTARLLAILDEKHVKASFFVVGGLVNADPALTRRITDAGHTIGNHSFSHPKMPKLGDAAIAAQLDDTNRAIERATGVTPRWVRPPYGEYDARVVAAAKQRGMAVAMWDDDTLDWKHRNPEETCRRALEQSHPGTIILMHDIHAPTVDAVPCVIDGLREKGLRPVSLDTMIPEPEPGRVYASRP